MTPTLAIIGALACAIGLGLIKAAENWNDMTKPPKGWMQHKELRHVLYCLLAVRCLRGGGAIYLINFMKAK